MAFTGIFFSHIKQVLHNPNNNSGTGSPEYGSLNPDSLEAAAPVLPNKDSGSGGSSDSSDQTDNSDEYTESHYPGILAADLTSLTNGQKNFFIITVTILCVMSVFGNMSTLFVNLRRKIRPFFRACLISLAFSDLMNTIFLSVAYLSQFTEEYVQIWSLGPLMCKLVPFATTAAILSSSMTLVGIAVDRYYAVMKAVIGVWHPTVISCIVCMLCIWLASIGIACPVFTIYDLLPVYILTEQQETDVSGGETTATTATNSTESRSPFTTEITNTTKTPWEVEASQEDLSYTLVREQKLVNMCVSNQQNVSSYYVIVFIIIFIPCIGAFFWFNIIIARKLWKRRYTPGMVKTKQDIKNKAKIKADVPAPTLATMPADQRVNVLQPQRQQNCNCRSGHTSSTTMPSSLAGTPGYTTTGSSSASSQPIGGTTHNTREARHLRMFTIILLMMAVFVFLRLPAWIYLLMRMYGSYSKPVHWVIYYTFGVMNMASSVLNPLFYTFLTETINYIVSFKLRMAAMICGHCSLLRSSCCQGEGRGEPPAGAMPNFKEPNVGLNCCDSFYGCHSLLRATWQCHQPHVTTERGMQQHSVGRGVNELCSKDNSQAVNSNERDEGVDCSDELEDEIGDFDMYNRRIYTIYPASLVSSSVNSQ